MSQKPAFRPERLVNEIDRVLKVAAVDPEVMEKEAFLGLIRWKLLNMLRGDMKDGQRVGTLRTAAEYKQEIGSAFMLSSSDLDQNLLMRLAMAYELQQYNGEAVFNMLRDEFSTVLYEVLDDLFLVLDLSVPQMRNAAELLERFEEERQTILSVILEDESAVRGRIAMEAHQADAANADGCSGMTTAELYKALGMSREEHGGPSGHKDSNWSIGYKPPEAWRPGMDADMDDGAQPC